jgi:hypothetical protein
LVLVVLVVQAVQVLLELRTVQQVAHPSSVLCWLLLVAVLAFSHLRSLQLLLQQLRVAAVVEVVEIQTSLMV